MTIEGCCGAELGGELRFGDVYVVASWTGGELRKLLRFSGSRVDRICGGLGRVLVVAADPTVAPELREGEKDADNGSVVEDLRVRQSVVCFENEKFLSYSWPSTIEGRKTGAIALPAASRDGALLVDDQSQAFSVQVPSDQSRAESPAFAGSDKTKELRAILTQGVSSIALTSNSHVALTKTGNVYSWGLGLNGELGRGWPTVSLAPKWVPFPGHPFTKISTLACGAGHAVALSTDGFCFSWGDNFCGQLGLGKKVAGSCDKPHVVEFPWGAPLKTVKAGWNHSIAVDENGGTYSWGLNNMGQLGLGDMKARFTPCEIALSGAACGLPRSRDSQHGRHRKRRLDGVVDGEGRIRVANAIAGVGFTCFLDSEGVAYYCGRPSLPAKRREPSSFEDVSAKDRLAPSKLKNPLTMLTRASDGGGLV